MLGKLAKWLRIFGFDAVFFTRIEDRDLLNLAGKEKRVLLTKDTGLLKMADIPSLYIESENWEHQMIQVLRRFRLKDQVRPYTRCVECNVPLKPLPKEKARNLVSPFVFERVPSFSLCPQCGRLFWPGTHHQDMCAKVEALLERI